MNKRLHKATLFPLARRKARDYSPRMKFRACCLASSALLLFSCEEKMEITVTETRQPSTRDTSPKLFATSDERFRDAKPSPVKGETPEGWLVLPPTQMRILNYRFGSTGNGEVWVSLSQGTVLDNVNRWLKQFGAAAADEAAMAKLPTVSLAGAPGVFVVAEGNYEGGMGSPPKPGSALAGVVAPINGQILTVKMVGPKEDVAAARPALDRFIQSLRMAE
jgi:hypothetical protein